MKRFFKPVGKEHISFKKHAVSVTDTTENLHGTESFVVQTDSMEGPLKFMTWNANSFLLRVKNNWAEFTEFVSTFDPDIIAIQEVRMPAAGTKGCPKRQGEIKDDTKSSREEKQAMVRAVSSGPFGRYRVWWSLADSKYAGTALFVRKCFEPSRVCFSLDGMSTGLLKHEADGRVIVAEFASFVFVNTYVPNNGWKEEEPSSSFPRRRKWDKKMLEFVQMSSSDKPLIWCGDLNVSHEDADVSHPDFFSSARLHGYTPPNEEDFGQPGFTLAERRRFADILREGRLVDAYRYVHREQRDTEGGFSWSGNPIGKYRGKRMRIDYFILSEKLSHRILSCDIHGRGIHLQGFYGSDHCPVTLQLCPPTTLISASLQ